MQVTIDPSLDADADLRAAVAARAPLLDNIFNGTATAEWRKGTNWEGKPVAQLRLSDATGARAGADLLPFEFLSPDKLEAKFRDLRDAFQIVRDWRAAVAELFATIRPWCESLPGNPRVHEEPLCMIEGESGEYETTQLVVMRGRWTLHIKPVAAWVVGWDGMIGMNGPGDRYMLYYSRAKNAWFHTPNNLPYRELLLTEALFRKLAGDALDG